MTIHVTPIPKLTNFGTPGFTLGTTNSAGDSKIAVASNSTLLTFDTSVPASVSTANATGSATVASRRDHVHEGVTKSTIVATSRTASAGAGDQAITGAGMTPTTIMVLAIKNSSSLASWGFGDDAAGEASTYMVSNGDVGDTSGNVIYIEGGSDDMFAVLKSLDADGCTLTWTKNGSGADVYYKVLFLR